MALKGVPKSAEHRKAISESRQTLTPNELARLIRVAKENCQRTLPATALARRFGMSKAGVLRILRQNGVVRPSC